jgi:hypothetical protein
LTERDLGAWKLLRSFRDALDRAQARHGRHRSFEDRRRRLELGDYLSLFLLGLLNPVARTMRGLITASQLPKVQRQVCTRAVSLGSFSEAQGLVDPALLESVFAGLAARLPDAGTLPPQLRAARWMARDSSLFAALPRMSWALYGGGRARASDGGRATAIRLHLDLDLAKDAPARARITEGKTCERAALRADIEPGDAVVADRYFGQSYRFLELLDAHGSTYVIRLMDRGVEPEILEELPCSDADQKAGIQRQARVQLGGERHRSALLRLIWLRGINGQILHLVTNLPVSELSAADAALLYKHRWQIEYFFRWVKCLMGCGHWLAESPRGTAIQLYLALIGAVLLQLQFGRRPGRRVWELLQWHLCGLTEETTLEETLARELAAEEKRRQRDRAGRVAKKQK